MDDAINKIYKYNLYWLSDEKTFRDYISQKFDELNKKAQSKANTGKELRTLRAKKNVPSYIKGSLIDNTSSIELKEELRYKFFSTNILPHFVELSKFCVVNDFFRYKQCNDYRLSRPLIALITTKENADKLRYLKNQDELKYQYIAFNYLDIKYSKKFEKRKEKPSFLRYNNMSDDFNRFLLRSVTERDNDDNYFYYVPVELGYVRPTNREKVKVRGYERSKKNAITRLEVSLNQERIELNRLKRTKSPKQEIKDQETRIKSIEEDIKNRVAESSQLAVKQEFRLESDYEYKKILERFKSRAETKLNIKLDLDDWSFCVIFSQTWCDMETKNMDSELLGYIGDSSDNINDKENSDTIDISILYFIYSCFKEPKIISPGLIKKTGELHDFDIVLRGFKEFENGGYWIKKIVKEKGIFKEKSEGPYNMRDGEIRVNILKNIMSLEGADVAKLYTYKDITSNYDILQDGVEKYVEPNHRYSPPQGALLFCLVNGYVDVAVFEKTELTKKFRKFSDNAINSGMKYISTTNYLIYYNPDSNDSMRKASELRALIRQKGDYTDSSFLWLVDDITGREIKRGEEPNIKPFKILSEYQRKGKITYYSMMEIYKLIQNLKCEENRLDISFQNLKNTFGDDNFTSYRNRDYQIKTSLNFTVVQDEEDDKPKKFKLTKNYDNTYEIGMFRPREHFKDIDLVAIKRIKNCEGYLVTKFKDLSDKTWEVSKLNLISYDENFNNEIVLICLNLFISKVFGVKKVILDNSLRTSECENNIMYRYYHIYYIGFENFERFEELGFVVENYKEYREVIDSIKEKTILQFVTENGLNVKVNRNIRNETLEKFCKDFVNTDACFVKNNLIIINQISAFIHSKIDLNVYINLEEVSFEHLSRYISF